MSTDSTGPAAEEPREHEENATPGPAQGDEGRSERSAQDGPAQDGSAQGDAERTADGRRIRGEDMPDDPFAGTDFEELFRTQETPRSPAGFSANTPGPSGADAQGSATGSDGSGHSSAGSAGSAGAAGSDPLESMLSSMLGPEMAAEALKAMKAQGVDPAAMAGQAGIPTDPSQLSMLLGQVQRMFSASGDGPVNWTLAGDLARQTAVHEGDPSISSAQASAVRDALHVADLWVDPVVTLPSASVTPAAWTRADWVRHTLPVWEKLSEPVAASVTQAMVDATAAQAEHLPPEMRQLLSGGAIGSMMKQMGGAVFGMQVGQAVGTLATEAFGATDIGLPLLDSHEAALVPANVESFAEDLDVPREEVRQFLAVREVASARLFSGVPWLRAHLLGAVEAYAREIRIDMGAIDEAMRGMDPSDPAGMQDMLRETFSHGGLFGQEPTAAQNAALARLELSLALVEGWVEHVAGQAARQFLPHEGNLREMLRRRRASGGPAEQTFATLVGLELRPKRVREASALWDAIFAESDAATRDGMWSHPDMLPTEEDLADPQTFVAARTREQDMGEEMLRILLSDGEVDPQSLDFDWDEWGAEDGKGPDGTGAAGGPGEAEDPKDH